MQGLVLVITGITSYSLACATERNSPLSSTEVHFPAIQTNWQGICEVTNTGKVSLNFSLISIHRKMTAEVKHNCCQETEQLKQLRHLL